MLARWLRYYEACFQGRDWCESLHTDDPQIAWDRCEVGAWLAWTVTQLKLSPRAGFFTALMGEPGMEDAPQERRTKLWRLAVPECTEGFAYEWLLAKGYRGLPSRAGIRTEDIALQQRLADVIREYYKLEARS